MQEDGEGLGYRSKRPLQAAKGPRVPAPAGLGQQLQGAEFLDLKETGSPLELPERSAVDTKVIAF